MKKSILKRLKNEQSPLIDGNSAIFVWQGKSAPRLVGDFTGWDEGIPVEMVKLESGVWTYQLDLPADAYIEYGFVSGGERLSDPFNPRMIPNGFGARNNYFSMPEYKPTELIKKNKTVAHGVVTSYRVSTNNLIAGEQRIIHLYQPPVHVPVPLMVVWDGQDYLRRVLLHNIVDNLIASGRIRPIALAMVNNGGQRARTSEYLCSEASLGFLMTAVLPIAEKNINLLDVKAQPGAYAVAGASMGGLMALYTGVRLPQVFGKVLSQSGAFSWEEFEMVIFDLLEYGEKGSSKVWMDAGSYDLPELLDSNRQMHKLLTREGYQTVYREFHAGHNYPAWRNDIWHGLEWLFGSR